MCGIAGIYLKPNSRLRDREIQSLADNLLLAIDHRGGDATGYLARTRNGEWTVAKAACPSREFLLERKEFPSGVHGVLLHTRFATQGHQGFNENNHPVGSGNFYVVHNGHIMNDDELCKKFGFPRLARVDSEAIAHIFRAKGLNSATTAMEKIEGAAAVAVMDISNGELVLARGSSSPLCMVETDSLIVWASETTAIREAWVKVLGTPPSAEKFHYVSEGTVIHLSPDGRKTTSRFDVPTYGNQWMWDEDDYEWEVTEHDGKTYWYKVKKSGKTLVGLPSETGAGCDLTAFKRSLEAGEEEELVDCDCCDDEYRIEELYEIYPGFSICYACEKILSDMTPAGSDIEETAEIVKFLDKRNIEDVTDVTEKDIAGMLCDGTGNCPTRNIPCDGKWCNQIRSFTS